MACDVTILLLTILSFILRVLPHQDVRVVSSPGFNDDHLYFELVDPHEIGYTFKIRPAKGFGNYLNKSFLGIELVPVDPPQACSAINNADRIRDNIALAERGGCSFLSKALQAEQAGALATIIMDNDRNNDEVMVDMIQDETDRHVNIAAYFLLGKDGYMIRKTLEEKNLPSAIINIPINATGIPRHTLNQPPWSLW